VSVVHEATRNGSKVLLSLQRNVVSRRTYGRSDDEEEQRPRKSQGRGSSGERCALVKHLASDPPFSKLDVVTCAEGPEPRAEAVAPTLADVVRRTESLLLDRYAPPGVIVNEHLEILHFRGGTGSYLEPTPGAPQNALLKMARKGLMTDLRIATAEAREKNTTVRRAAMTIEHDGTQRRCDIVVIPILAPPISGEHIFAVLFEARFHTDEDVTSVNEELVSSNEEFQSAKEELQSTNEELSTLNEELRVRNSDLNTVNGDLINVLASTDIALVIVDRGRRIRRFTERVRPLLNLQSSDIGRPIAAIKPKLAITDLERSITAVIDSLVPHEEEAKGDDGRWYRLQIRPYATVDKRIDGAVLTIVDIDVLKKAVGAAEWTRDLAQAIVDAVQLPEVVLDEKLSVLSINEAFTERYGLTKREASDKSVFEIVDGAFDVPALRLGLGRVVDHDERLEKL
jgi:two-component system CheB/CheR fusion protein